MTLGHPTTIAVGLLLIPIMLILASILPGKVLPLADLPVAPFLSAWPRLFIAAI